MSEEKALIELENFLEARIDSARKGQVSSRSVEQVFECPAGTKIMRPYELTKDAETDLEGIARYTIEHWGEVQAKSYLDKISQSCNIIQQSFHRPWILEYCRSQRVYAHSLWAEDSGIPCPQNSG